ncbi:hypothetical protein SAMN05880501_10756 [Ureibacillus xyleni]|uniref:Prophage pi2 protein 38 n=1 Tax=Ureibacillus xyleni TaxID=614648 RepID=A0A285SX25_9BACL|nr:hypothetical protein [Ureibacillus xyleni]SOC12813.1 hypothetical protein SAMN05880501_10756 [Ureibacillus xyleni]
MILQELAQALETLNIPVTYSHFNDPQTPPFICYLVTGSDNFNADNTTYQEFTNVDIELYTKKKDITLENQLKQLLKDNELPFDYSSVFINEEKIYKITYEVTL